MRNYETDVLVIGGGGAGLMAAFEASRHNVRVGLVLKGQTERSGSTIMAPGAIAGVGSWGRPGDTKDLHFRDTVAGGSFMNEQNLVRIMVEESPQRILELERLGALWEREDDGKSYLLRIDGGHTTHRCVYLEDRTGREMVRTLTSALARRHVPVWENVMIMRLLMGEKGVAGAVGIDLSDSEVVLFKCRAVILATGGAGQIYSNTDVPTDVTGDGYSLAFDVGSELMDMEFVQFYPIGFLHPPSLRGILAGLLYYSHLLNSKGERFMQRYDAERLELSTRDRVARAIVSEVSSGNGTPLGGVYCDMTFQPPGFIARQTPTLYQTYRQIGVDPEKDMFEIAPSCHHFMGGLVIDDTWATTTPGLYAAGESCAGVHGANRLSQNALAELIVSGTRAGRSAARHALGTKAQPVEPEECLREQEKVQSLLGSAAKEGLSPWNVREKLKNLMWEKVGVLRDKEGLETAREELASLEDAAVSRTSLAFATRIYNQDLRMALENEMMVQVGKLIVESALLRTESRGAHYRSDYSKTDNDNWLKHVVWKKDDERLISKFRPTDLTELKPEE